LANEHPFQPRDVGALEFPADCIARAARDQRIHDRGDRGKTAERLYNDVISSPL
jgi:hypothetical protein